MRPNIFIVQKVYNVTVTVYGMVSQKASHSLRPLLIYCLFLIRVLIIPDSFSRALWQYPVDTPSSKARKTGRNVGKYCLQVSHTLETFNMQ
jgi:hypothetical protein